MEERVELLEGELLKVGESLQLLSHHYNILQHFLQYQFGHKFQEFYEKEVDGQDGSSLDDSQQFYDDSEQGTEDEEAYIREIESAEGADEGEHGEDDGDDEEDPGLGELLHAQAGIKEEVELEDANMSPPAVVLTMGSGSPGPPKLTPQQARTTGNSSQSPQAKYVQNSQSIRGRGGASSSSRGGAKSNRPPPPLLHRPVPSSSTPMRSSPSGTGAHTVNSKPGSQRTLAQKTAPLVMKPTFRRTTNGALVPVDPKAFQDDLNGGKYGRYYRKVNSELIQCKICNKILKRRGKFVQHLRTHTGEKPFTCESCGATFSRRDNMNVHMQRHHPSDPSFHQGNGNGSNGNYNGDDSPPGESIIDTSCELLCYMCYKPLRNQGEYNTHLQQEHGVKTEEEDDDEEMYNDGQDDYNEEHEGESYYT